GEEATRTARIINTEIGQASRYAFDQLGQAARDAGDDITSTGYEVSDAASIIANEIELARVNIERFGQDGVEQMGDFKDATEDALSPFSDLRKQLDAEKTFDRLAEQIERIKASPGDRDETRRL